VVEVRGDRGEGVVDPYWALVVEVPSEERYRMLGLPPSWAWCTVPPVRRIVLEGDGERIEARVSRRDTVLVVRRFLEPER
jgi:hypothetical protein